MDQYVSYLNWIDNERKGLIEALQSWANIHSGSDNPAGLARMLEKLKEAFSSLEGEMEAIPLPPRRRLQADGNITETELGQLLSISRRPEAPIQILLAGHMDIALSKDAPLEKCKRKSRDILTGRGTADMKSGLLIMLNAVKSLEMSPYAERIGWKVLINPDEEIGSPGSGPILQREAKKFNLGLIFEPSLPDGSLVSFRNGSANYTIAVKGRAAHVGRDFSSGANAVTSAARIALAAESLTELSEEITVNVGHLSGGGPLNSVPDKAVCGINIRTKSPADFKRSKEKIKKIAEIENHRDAIQTILHHDSERPPKVFDKKTRSLFEALKRCADPLGLKIAWKKTGGVCDGNLLAQQGLPTIDTLGGVGGNLHTADEFVSIISIIQRTKLVARFLMQIAAGEVAVK